MSRISLTFEERQLQARAAAHTRAALYDPVEVTQGMRDAFVRKLRDQVVAHAAEKGETLSEKEVDRRTESLRKAHLSRAAYASVRARRLKKEAKAKAGSE